MDSIVRRGLLKLMSAMYMPVCRRYARHRGDRPADSLLRGLCAVQFAAAYGVWPNFVTPRTFSEKVWSRQLHSRDQRLTMVSDKYRVREYVRERLGDSYLVPLLWDGDRPEAIPFDQLPSRFVIKMNHGCDFNIIVADKTTLDKASAIRLLNQWSNVNFCNDTFLGIAWAYKNITPRIIIEAFLGDNGEVPIDHKFFCFSGRVEFLKMDFARFTRHATRFFDRELNPLELVEVGLENYAGNVVVPSNFDEMFRIAEMLATGWDFIRVDMYNVNGRIYFGELTPYPGGVSDQFRPEGYDVLFGSKWERASIQGGVIP